MALVKWIFFHGENRTTAVSGGENALQILKKRYARGEIDKEQYLAMKRDLET
ncbi:MAG: SHOCT domain-containing protein [Desulfobacterales bacterium]